MTAERWAQVRSAVERAVSLSMAERVIFLDQIHGRDLSLWQEVDALLAMEPDATSLFSIDQWNGRVPEYAERDLAGTVVGRYRLIREIGRGGMGKVFLAERADGEFQQRVALKLLQESMSGKALIERFRQERQILARLEHPGIARLVDGGITAQETPYAVMEYVDGVPIDQFCEVRGLDLRTRLRLFLKVARAVQYAHQQLVLHLDLKPANILVTESGEPRLLDFGIARLVAGLDEGQSAVETTLRLLTPRYASPEQIAGEPLGVASDVFSLGTLLYKLLTDRLPYPIDGVGPMEAARILREVAPMPPSGAAPERRGVLKGDLDLILLQALRKDPARRYPTVAALAQDVERYLESQPVRANKDSLAYRTRKFARRHRAPLMVATVALVLLMASVAAVVRTAVVARQQRALADRRFSEVRALAHSYIFDLDPKLETIQGTVNVRAFVLKNALNYLDAISRETTDDAGLDAELAEGYGKVAHVQSRHGVPALSDDAGARQSYLRSVELARRVLAKTPGNAEQVVLLLNDLQELADLERGVGDMSAAERYAEQAWEAGQPILATGPKTPGFSEMMNLALTLAQNKGAQSEGSTTGDARGALIWLDRSDGLVRQYEALPKSEQPNPLLPLRTELSALIVRASVLRQLQKTEAARATYERALTLALQLEGNSPLDKVRRMVVRYTFAQYLLELHDAKEAAEVAPPAEPVGVTEKGADRQQRIQVADIEAVRAKIDLELGDRQKGMAEVKNCRESFEALYREQPDDNFGALSMAESFFDMGEEPALAQSERTELFRRGLAVIQPQLKANPDDLQVKQDDAEGRLRMVDSYVDVSACLDRLTLLDEAEADLRAMLKAQPANEDAKRMIRQAENLRAGRHARS